MGSLSIPLVVVMVAVLIATVTDVRSFKIHNLLTIPLLISGLVYHGITGGVDGLIHSVIGALFGFCILFMLFLMGGMGAGDVKLMAGVGAWLGMPGAFLLLLAASLATGVYSLVVIVLNGRFRQTWVNLQIIFHRAAAISRHLVADDRVEEVAQSSDRRSRLIPFGAMMAIGLLALLALVQFRNPVVAGGVPDTTQLAPSTVGEP